MPTVPTGIAAAPDFGGIRVTATTPPDATGFNVYRGTAPTGLTLYFTVSPTSNPSYIVRDTGGNLLVSYDDPYPLTHAVFGTTYYYAVTATSSGGESALSSVVSAASQSPGPLGTVTGSAGELSVSLLWSALTHADYYAILQTVGSFGQQVATTTGTSYTDTGLSHTTAYSYQVIPFHNNPAHTSRSTAWDFGGGGSSAGPFTPTAPPAPTTPASLSATAGNASVSLSWAASTSTDTSAVIRYAVKYGTASGVETTAGPSNIGGTSCTVTGLTNGTPYFFTVYASDRGSNSANATEATATPVAPPAPAAPTGLSASVAGGNLQVALTWTGVTNVHTFNLYRSTISGGPYTLVGASGSTSYTDYSVTGGNTYYYVVRSVGDGTHNSGESVNSSQVSGAPTSPPPPVPTAPLSPAAYASIGAVSLYWNAPANAAAAGALTYNVYKGTATGAESGTPLTTGLTALTYTDSAVTNGTAYFYYIKAVGASGTSVASAEVHATPVALAPFTNLWADGGTPAISAFTDAPRLVDNVVDDSGSGYPGSVP